MLSGEVLISGGTNWDLIGRSQVPKGGELRCRYPRSKAVLQIRRCYRDNLGIFSIFSHKNLHCDQSIEPRHRGRFNERSQHMFPLRNMENYL